MGSKNTGSIEMSRFSSSTTPSRSHDGDASGKKDGDRTTVHRAPVIYTPSPCRAHTKKIILPVETSPATSKKNKQLRAPSRLTTDGSSPVPVPDDGSPEGMKLELLKVQRQVEQLKLKFQDKELVLQSIRQSDARVLEKAERAQSDELRSKVEELQKEVMRKDFQLHCAQLQLAEKKEEISNMKLLLQGLNHEIERRDYQLSHMERDLELLHFQRQSSFRMYAESPVQLNISASPEPVSHVGSLFPTTGFTDGEEEEVEEFCVENEMEEMRKKYVAALLQAKSKPVDDNIQLVAELRRQLEDLLSQTRGE